LSGALWHPFADMGSVEGAEFVLERGEGAWVWDEGGRRYLDATASLWYSNLGHSRPEIAAAIEAQSRKLDAYGIFGDYTNRPAIELADRLAALAPVPGSKVFLGSGGGDMIDTAAKLARAFHDRRGESDRQHLIGRTHGYHGTHGFGTSVGGIAANRAGYGPIVADASTVAFDDPAALEAEIQRIGPGRVAGFFCEPVIGAGGVHLPPDGYIEAVAEICQRHGILFIADCVICAFGRLGTWFGIDRWPVRPDMVVLAKGISNGAQPVGALLVAPEIAEPFFTGAPGAPVFRHGATYAGHPTCAVAALTTLDIYEREGVIDRGRNLEGPLAEALRPVAEHAAVGEVRAGLGFLAGIDLTADLVADGAVVRLQLGCRERGVLVRPLGKGIAISPPLICGEEEIDLIAGAIRESLDPL
jgi:putrescine---pyruvate transaminase